MKRLAAVVCTCLAGVATLIVSAPAGAAISPKLAITPTTSGGANLIISGGSSNPAEDAFQKIQIYVPTGFGLNAPVGGASVGTMTGHGLVKDVDATQEQGFTGTITATGIADPAFAYENANCDATTHAAVWNMQVRANDTSPVTIPIFVDRTSGTRGRIRVVQARHVPALARPAEHRPEPQHDRHEARQLRADADRIHGADGGRRLPLALGLDAVHARERAPSTPPAPSRRSRSSACRRASCR